MRANVGQCLIDARFTGFTGQRLLTFDRRLGTHSPSKPINASVTWVTKKVSALCALIRM
jgi:hypothetical protein